MNCITVLNFETGKVYQYEEIWNPDSESIEDFLECEGHNVNSCEWMFHEDGLVVKKEAQ